MRLTILFVLASSLLGACGSSTRPVEITETLTVQTVSEVVPAQTSSAERFAYARSEAPGASPTGDAHDSCPHTEQGVRGACCPDEGNTSSIESQSSFQAQIVPSGWTMGADRPMRLVTFTIDDRENTECYTTVLAGSGGGLEANVNRWRGQMGQSPLTPGEVAALPTIQMLGRQAVLVEVKGEYTGMDGAAQPESMMLGAICALPTQTLFVKMSGPEAAVAAERENFVSFCESLVEENAEA